MSKKKFITLMMCLAMAGASMSVMSACGGVSASEPIASIESNSNADSASDETPRVVEFKVTFNSLGGSDVKAQFVKNGAKATKPEDPTREDYTFVEWLPERQWQILDRGGWVLGAADTADIEADAAAGLELQDILSNELKAVMTEIEVKKDADPEADEDQSYYGIVFSPYGAMVKPANRIYFLVGEAKMRGDRLRYAQSIEDNDKVPLNSLVLSVNPFTGRVETRPYED